MKYKRFRKPETFRGAIVASVFMGLFLCSDNYPVDRVAQLKGKLVMVDLIFISGSSVKKSCLHRGGNVNWFSNHTPRLKI